MFADFSALSFGAESRHVAWFQMMLMISKCSMTLFYLLSVQMYDMLFITEIVVAFNEWLLPPVCFLSVQDAGCYASITLGLDLCPD